MSDSKPEMVHTGTMKINSVGGVIKIAERLGIPTLVAAVVGGLWFYTARDARKDFEAERLRWEQQRTVMSKRISRLNGNILRCLERHGVTSAPTDADEEEEGQ